MKALKSGFFFINWSSNYWHRSNRVLVQMWFSKVLRCLPGYPKAPGSTGGPTTRDVINHDGHPPNPVAGRRGDTHGAPFAPSPSFPRVDNPAEFKQVFMSQISIRKSWLRLFQIFLPFFQGMRTALQVPVRLTEMAGTSPRLSFQLVAIKVSVCFWIWNQLSVMGNVFLDEQCLETMF